MDWDHHKYCLATILIGKKFVIITIYIFILSYKLHEE